MRPGVPHTFPRVEWTTEDVRLTRGKRPATCWPVNPSLLGPATSCARGDATPRRQTTADTDATSRERPEESTRRPSLLKRPYNSQIGHSDPESLTFCRSPDWGTPISGPLDEDGHVPRRGLMFVLRSRSSFCE